VIVAPDVVVRSWNQTWREVRSIHADWSRQGRMNGAFNWCAQGARRVALKLPTNVYTRVDAVVTSSKSTVAGSIPAGRALNRQYALAHASLIMLVVRTWSLLPPWGRRGGLEAAAGAIETSMPVAVLPPSSIVARNADASVMDLFSCSSRGRHRGVSTGDECPIAV